MAANQITHPPINKQNNNLSFICSQDFDLELVKNLTLLSIVYFNI